MKHVPLSRRETVLGLSAVAVAGPALAQAPRDWRRSVRVLPSGAVLVGNPAAPVKLIEYLSYTCGHCAHFVAESHDDLRDRLVREGKVMVDHRPALRDALDLAAGLLAFGAGPRFLAVQAAIFDEQASWMAAGAAWVQANQTALSTGPRAARLRAIADGSGLLQLARGAGLAQPAIAAAFTEARVAALSRAAADAWKVIASTPSFAINGARVAAQSWPTLRPALAAAGAA